ncbi:hypothetical protein CE91St41_38250 [Oscillospiraceae bacterium]|nr:hypothetical protein CE91St40_38230 [Oscillospiraceae bacterium]BDF76936.1 hypothetical protein CE91St41_38250 [Oscillospiraceae bacterium]
MTTIEKDVRNPALEDFFTACFARGEILRRELRLTPEQAEYARTTYPADLRPMGGAWYEITFKGAYTDGYKS